MNLTIRASDVAACIGMNPYKSVEEMLSVYVAKCMGDKLDHSFDITKEDLEKLVDKVQYSKKELEECKSEEDYNKLHQKIIRKVSSKSVWANSNSSFVFLFAKFLFLTTFVLRLTDPFPPI